MQVDFGYFDHYHSFIFDAYDADGVCSIKRGLPRMSTVPRWIEASEHVQNYRQRMADCWTRAGELGPIEDPGYVLLYLQGSSFSSVLPGIGPNDYDGWVARADAAVREAGERPVWKYASIHKRKMPVEHIGYGSRIEGQQQQAELNSRLLRYAKHSVVITSSVSNEPVLRGLPVVSCGRGWHRGSGAFLDVDDWAGLATTPEVDHEARGRWINWWLGRQVPMKDAAFGLERALWEAKPNPRRIFYGIGRGLGNLIMAAPAMKAASIVAGAPITVASGKYAARGYRELIEAQPWVDGRVERAWPADLNEMDAATGVAWEYYVPPVELLGVGCRREPPGPAGRGPHEGLADAVPVRRLGYGHDVLPSARLRVERQTKHRLPPAFIAVGMDCTDGQTWSLRRWPHWQGFARSWQQRSRLPLVFLGTVPTEWAAKAGIDLVAKTTVPEAASIIADAEAFVGIDGGLCHVAAAVGTPAVVLYGPTTSWREGPRCASLTPIASGRRCRACFMSPEWTKCKHAECMERIRPERVAGVLLEVLERGGRPLDAELAWEQVQGRLGYTQRANVKPAQAREDLMAVWPLVRDLRPQRVLEVGVKRGGWCYTMAPTFAEGAHIVMLDIEPKGVIHKAISMLRAEAYTVDLVIGDSGDAQTVERVRQSMCGGGPIDLVHLDGDHTTEATLRDWGGYAPMVRDGGIVLFHDAYSLCEGVSAALGELMHTREPYGVKVREWRTYFAKRDRGNVLGIAAAIIGPDTR